MEYIRFGSTGLKVSRICLGCMSYGGPTECWQWALDEEQSRPFIKRALELGINFFDTANVYSDGGSEKVVITWTMLSHPSLSNSPRMKFAIWKKPISRIPYLAMYSLSLAL